MTDEPTGHEPGADTGIGTHGTQAPPTDGGSAPQSGTPAGGQGQAPEMVPSSKYNYDTKRQRELIESEQNRATQAEAALAEAQAKIKGFEDAQLSEQEKRDKRIQELEERERVRDGELQRERLLRARSDLIASEGTDVLPAYQHQVAGASDEDLRASLIEVRQKQKTDQVGLLRWVATATPEQIVERYGEDAKILAERFKAAPTNVGAPRPSGATPPPSGSLSSGLSPDWFTPAHRS